MKDIRKLLYFLSTVGIGAALLRRLMVIFQYAG